VLNTLMARGIVPGSHGVRADRSRQSLWLDNVSREMLDSGRLQRLHRRILVDRTEIQHKNVIVQSALVHGRACRRRARTATGTSWSARRSLRRPPLAEVAACSAGWSSSPKSPS